ncbi:helix-turn-helix transcriptional regulator [Actinosynnema sp. NPDC023794]
MMSQPERVTEPLLDILQAFWEAEEGLYAYQLAKRTKRGRPTIYNNLDRLSTLGWIANGWEDPTHVQGRPIRRVYHFTSAGRTHAAELLLKAGRIAGGQLDVASDASGGPE